MALSRVHTSTKAADVIKLLPLNTHQATHLLIQSMMVPRLTVTLTLMYCDPDYHQNVLVSSVLPFYQIV